MKINIFHNKKWYINKIKGFVMNMTRYNGEWCKGFHHKYQIYIKDIIPDFIIFEIHVDNGDLSFFGYNLKINKETMIMNSEDILTKEYARKIYKFLKGIDIFWYKEL